MTVYVVSEHSWDWSKVIGVFTEESVAQAICAETFEDSWRDYENFNLDSRLLIDPP